MINWQLWKQGIRWPVSHDRTAGSSVDPSRSTIFWSYPLKNYQFQMIAGSSLFFQWFILNMLCLCHYGPALLRFWFQTDLGRENSASFFKGTGGEDLFLPLSRVGHALRPIFMLWLVKIWQVSDRVLCQLVMFLTVFFLWMYKMKYSCYQGSSVIHGWFVDWVFGREMRRLSKFGKQTSHE